MGIELGEYYNGTCILGFRISKVFIPEGGVDYITYPIGCAGGPTIDTLMDMVFPLEEGYLICRA
ncbi:MAG: hypothetical protein QXG18_01970 [Candidatus Pacearchaeota archaeon]